MTEISLFEKKDLREQLAGRVEVLDKVKKLFLMPKIDMMTTRQVADYYEVPEGTIKRTFSENRDEIISDGAIMNTTKDLLKFDFRTLEQTQYKTTFQIADDIVLAVPNRGIRMFSQRAVLRMGMLLRDSEVAKEVRTQLLNTFEHTTEEQKTVDIDNESELIAAMGLAFAKNDIKAYCEASMNYNAFKDRYITQLKHDNKLIAAEVLEWSDRSSINKAMRVIATRLNVPFSWPWGWLYDELRYKHSIGLSNRGKSPAIQWVREDEWPKVQQCICAICENKGLSPSKVMAAAKLLPDEVSKV